MMADATGCEAEASSAEAAPRRATAGFGPYNWAQVFWHTYREQYLPSAGGTWYVWQTTHWVPVNAATVRGRLWFDLSRWFSEERLRPPTKSVVDGVYDAITTMTAWYVDPDQLNRPSPAGDVLVPFQNCVLNLGTLDTKPHDPADRQTILRPYAYQPEATCPQWLQFLREVLVSRDGQGRLEPDEELIRLMQEWFGYCLVPETRAQKACIWYGEGANGKGVATEVLIHLIGPENHVPLNIADLNREYTRATLRDKLLAVSTEVPSRALVEDAQFKAIISGDRIHARLPHRDPFYYKPISRILITCNSLPLTRDQTWAFYRRLIVVPFNASFRGTAGGEVAHSKAPNPYLADDLLRELPGIFNWALAGLQRLKAQDWRFSPAAAVDQALRTYQVEGSSVLLWAADRLEAAPNHSVPARSLYADYSQWCRENGHLPLASNNYIKPLRDNFRGLTSIKMTLEGCQVRGWRGVRLLPLPPLDSAER